MEEETTQESDWTRFSKGIRAKLHKPLRAHMMPLHAPDTKHGVTVCNTHHAGFQCCFGLIFVSVSLSFFFQKMITLFSLLSCKYVTFF